MSVPWNRREFVRSSAASAVLLSFPKGIHSLFADDADPIRFGIIADLHQDIMHDAPQRLGKFLAAMDEVKPDAIIQLGDFAVPSKKNQSFLDPFNDASMKPMHVLGNHDMDGGHTRQQCMDTWGMPSFYYARNVGGVLLLVLDGNDKDSPTHQGGYARFIGPEQVEWLKEQLSTASVPVIVVSHQPLAGPSAIDNAREIQDVLGEHSSKILFAMNGHTHIDYLVEEQGVVYWHVNSASYKWVGGNHIHTSYPTEIHEKFPYISYTCPYREPLYATLTIDPKNSRIQIDGTSTKWVGPSPADIKVKPIEHTGDEPMVPRIRNRTMAMAAQKPGK